MNISNCMRYCAQGALVFGMLVGYAHAQGTSSIPAGKQPNIVLVLMDNLGWGEPGVYSGGILRGAPTPRIDQHHVCVPEWERAKQQKSSPPKT
jgi:hypothetical protein